MTISLQRRYTTVAVAAQGDAFVIMLDALPLQTPAKAALYLPTAALARAIAAEWNLQQGKLDFTKLPLTQLAMTAQDLPVDKTALLDFLETELIVHYAEDPALVTAQEMLWHPLQAWLTQRFGTVLSQTVGILPNRGVSEPGRIRTHLDHLDAFRLTALSEAASALGSFVIALALVEGQVDVAGAVAAAEIDSDYQMLRWGRDPDMLLRRAALQSELDDIARFLALLH